MYLIAEIGINHNGDLKLAKDMISEAKHCGANAVKFQKRDVKTVYAKVYNDLRETPPGELVKLMQGGETQWQQKQALELTWDEYDEIDRHCKIVNIDWFASAWDTDSLWFIEQYKPPYHKVASAIVTHIPFVVEVAKLGRQIIMSTAGSTYDEIRKAVNILRKYKVEHMLMHCVAIYPCPLEKCNLQRIHTLKSLFNCEVGYSSHESSVDGARDAISQGAGFIEVHFTLDRAMYGSDQAASLEPKGLREIAQHGRAHERLNLVSSNEVDPKEMECMKKLRYFESS